MIYEFIATITAGFGMAGLALIVRHLTKLLTRSKRQAPKWLIPIFAGIGMLGFQIYQEYHWQEGQIATRGDNLRVIKQVEGEVWYRPWSYIKPQVIRVMAVGDVHSLPAPVPAPTQQDIKVIHLYLLERRVSTKIVPQLIDCATPAIASDPTLANAMRQAATSKDASVQTDELLRQANWLPLEQDDELVQVVCQ